MLPPPSPIEMMSGIRKFVRTSPISTSVDASRGKPFMRTPTSDVVPPMSTTTASPTPERRAAPRMQFVGPEANVRIGYVSANSEPISVPSFWLT